MMLAQELRLIQACLVRPLNAAFNEDEPRDNDGRWTNGGDIAVDVSKFSSVSDPVAAVKSVASPTPQEQKVLDVYSGGATDRFVAYALDEAKNKGENIGKASENWLRIYKDVLNNRGRTKGDWWGKEQNGFSYKVGKSSFSVPGTIDDVKKLDSVIEKGTLKKDTILYRYLGNNAIDRFDVAKPGESIKIYSYQSTTPTLGGAPYYKERNHVLLRLFVPKGTHAYGFDKVEKEILLPRGLTYTVLHSAVQGTGVLSQHKVVDVLVH